MKYIIFEEERTGIFSPVLFPEHVTHSDIKIIGTKPISAGFCILGGEDIISILPEISDSLQIGPGENDKRLIIATLANSGMYDFLKY